LYRYCNIMNTRRKNPPNSWLGHELLQRSSTERESLCAPLVAGFLWPRRAGDPPFRDAPEPPHVTIRDVPGEFVDRVEKLFEQMVPYHDRAVETIRHHPDRAALTTDDLVAGMGAPATDPELSDLLYGLGLYLLAKLRYCTPRPRGTGKVQQLRALCVPIGEHCRVTEDGVRFPMIGTIPLEFPNESPRELYAVILWARWAERRFQVVLVSPRQPLESPESVPPCSGHQVVKLGVTFSKRQEALFLELVRYHRLVFNRGIDKLRALKDAGQPYRLSFYDMCKWVTNAHAELGPDVAALKTRYGQNPARSALKQLSVAVEHHRKIPEQRDLTLTNPVISVAYPDRLS